ncbi:MAG: 2Fe-2S iron-sulfur cluster-binding protein, partial [Pseudomonadota bacterium]
MTGWRHPYLGHEVNRKNPVSFHFDGRPIEGFEGDTVASALIASGIQIVGRSFKYHRPRGIVGFGAEEPNALVDVTLNGKTTPNQRATLVSIRDGMDIRTVNASPDAGRDRFAVMDRFHRFIPAGFYYKTFMAFGWMFWEPMIRRMAGLGRLDPLNEPPADIRAQNGDCDVLVIGAGPSGLAAALSASAAGKTVWLVDDGVQLGGGLRWRGGTIDGEHWSRFADEVQKSVQEAGGRILSDTTLWGAFDQKMFAAWQRGADGSQIHWRIRARETILAAGAIERPLWFADNDKPGVMSAEAALYHLNCHGAMPGSDIVVATANDLTYPVAAALKEAGASVTLVDERSKVSPLEGIRQITNARVTAALGRNAVGGALVNGEYVSTDCILVSGGYTPSVHLW